jgi:hypothetical protein
MLLHSCNGGSGNTKLHSMEIGTTVIYKNQPHTIVQRKVAFTMLVRDNTIRTVREFVRVRSDVCLCLRALIVAKDKCGRCGGVV